LLTEIGFPDGDGEAKESHYMEDSPTGASDVNADALAGPITGGDGMAEPHVAPDDPQPTTDQTGTAGPREHESYFEEESAGRGSASPTPKKFPEIGDHRRSSEDTDRGSDDND